VYMTRMLEKGYVLKDTEEVNDLPKDRSSRFYQLGILKWV